MRLFTKTKPRHDTALERLVDAVATVKGQA
jgi:hypothetical protein